MKMSGEPEDFAAIAKVKAAGVPFAVVVSADEV